MGVRKTNMRFFTVVGVILALVCLVENCNRPAANKRAKQSKPFLPVPQAIARKAAQQKCPSNTQISATHGEIWSHSVFDGRTFSYKENSDCRWTMKARPDCRWTIQLVHFDVDCKGDWVSVSEASGQPIALGKYCGRSAPFPNLLFSKTDAVVIHFHSDSKNQRTGFHIKFWSCGWAEQTAKEQSIKVIGGGPTEPSLWPWNVQLLNERNGHACGGTLITPEFIITNAKCLIRRPVWRYKARLGAGQSWYTPGDGIAINLGDATFIVHRYFNATGASNFDVALIKLRQPVALPLMKYEECRTLWGASRINDMFVCAGTSRQGICTGDQGGGLYCKQNGKWAMAAIASFYDPRCKELPPVFEKMDHLNVWIRRQMTQYWERGYFLVE